MNLKSFFSFRRNKFFWLNIAGMTVVVIAVFFITFHLLDVYTYHGKAIQVPNVTDNQREDAAKVLADNGLGCDVMDYRFVKGVKENTVIEQKPAAGARVKKGRIIYLTLSTSNEPTITIPDIIDNCSLREGQARLMGAGFKLTPCDSIQGEKDWIYGLLYRKDTLRAGDAVPMGATLTIIIGNGEEAAPETSEGEATVDDSWFE